MAVNPAIVISEVGGPPLMCPLLVTCGSRGLEEACHASN